MNRKRADKSVDHKNMKYAKGVTGVVATSKTLFEPLIPESHLHDMKTGPCKCGAWHSLEDNIQ